MKILAVRLWMLRVPLRTPFRTALRTVGQIEDIVVSIHTDDVATGYGEAPPTAAITGETHASIIAAINRIVPHLIGESLDDVEYLCGLIQRAVANNNSAKAAVEIAVYDLYAQLRQLPLYRVFGGEQRLLTTDITISIDSIDKMVADSLDAVGRGFTALKIKVGTHIGEDIERVKAIHAALGGRAALRLDANQGWTAQQAVTAMHALESAGIVLDLLEQPVPARDLEGLQFVSERIATPVMADESAFDVEQALEVIRRRAASILSIKLMKCGGIANALRIADVAAEHGVECMMSCMIESSISVAAAAHVAAARPHVITRIDLDGPSLCTFNPVEGGVAFDEAQIRIPMCLAWEFMRFAAWRLSPEQQEMNQVFTRLGLSALLRAAAMLLLGNGLASAGTLPWSDAQQMVLVIIDDWSSDHGTLQIFQRRGAQWHMSDGAMPVTIGHSGAAWGLGLHEAQPGAIKREGDGRSPAGVYRIGEAFGYATTAPTSLPYQQMKASHYCVDVPNAADYNRIVDTRVVGEAAVAQSTEPMRRDLHLQGDQRYRLGFVIEHNRERQRGAGSCIFAHLWKAPGAPTAGCTAMDEATMERLLSTLHAARRPVFVLLPRKEYERLHEAWALPDLGRP